MIDAVRNVINALSHQIASVFAHRQIHPPSNGGSNVVVGALLDAGTSTLLTVTSRPSILRMLNELVPGTVFLRTVHYARKPAVRAIVNGRTADYPLWQWSQESGSFVPAHETPSEALRARAALATAKRQALYLLIERVNSLRFRPSAALDDQSIIYFEKRDQAHAFKATGYDPAALPRFPYVEQYAALANRTPRQAADEIIFQARLRDDELLRSEAVRLRYIAIIRDAQKASDLDTFREDIDAMTMQVLK